MLLLLWNWLYNAKLDVFISDTPGHGTKYENDYYINTQRRNLDANDNNNTQIPNDGVISGNYGEERKRRRGNDDIQEIDLDQLCANCCFIY